MGTFLGHYWGLYYGHGQWRTRSASSAIQECLTLTPSASRPSWHGHTARSARQKVRPQRSI